LVPFFKGDPFGSFFQRGALWLIFQRGFLVSKGLCYFIFQKEGLSSTFFEKEPKGSPLKKEPTKPF
jgi:hypothetical protein